MQHYSTELELQHLVELSAVDEEKRRLQEKRTAIVAGTVDPFTSTPNSNLRALQSATFNQFAQPCASTLTVSVPQPWTMSGYATPLQTSLIGVPGRQLMAGANTQVKLQLLTSMSQPPAHPPPEDSSLNSGRDSVSAGPSQNSQNPTKNLTRRRKSRTQRSMPSEQKRLSSTASC